MQTFDLRLGDCSEILRSILDESVDALVTDPPFGIGYNYESGREIANTPESYWKWLFPIYTDALRTVKPGGFVAIWQTAPYMKHFWSWYGDDIHIYAACKNFVQLRKTPINYAYDPVVMLYKPGAEPLRPPSPPRNVDFFVSNTASLVSNTSRPERQHPAPRPVDVVQEIVSNFTSPNAIVLDPFMGSGTAGVACASTGRSFIGIEIEPKYFSIAESRIATARQQTHLFF